MIVLLPRFGPPPDASLDGHRVDAAMRLAVELTGAAGFTLVIVLVAMLVAYRARPGHRARYERGESRTHTGIVAAVALLVFIAMDVNLARRARADIDAHRREAPRGPNALRVEVMAQQFAWHVRYAGADGRFATADDALALDEIRVPLGAPVHVALVARDVIHSFFVPAFRLKQDAIPGRVTHTWFTPVALGRYEIACAQLCGFGHDSMRGEVRVVPRDAFDAWMRDRSDRSRASHDANDIVAQWGWGWVE